MKASRQIDKVGIAGAVLAALCCLGVTAAMSLLSAVGLEALVNDRVLAPLMLAFLGIALAGLGIDAKHHHHRAALALGVVAAVALALFSFVAPSRAGAYGAILALVAASGWNIYFGRHPV